MGKAVITSAEEGGKWVCLFVCMFICPLDYSKSADWILMNFFGGVVRGTCAKFSDFGAIQ